MIIPSKPGARKLYFDTETELISPNPASPPPAFVACGWAVDDGPAQLTQDLDEARAVVADAIEGGRVLVGHNLAFDLAVLGIVPPRTALLHDTMIADLLQRLAEDDCEGDQPGPPRPRSLEYLSGRKLEGKGTIQLGFIPGVPLTKEQRRYLLQDVSVTREVEQLQSAAGVPGSYPEMTLQVRARMALDVLQRTGVGIDLDAIKELRTEYRALLREAAHDLGEFYRPERTGARGGKYSAGLRVKLFQEYLRTLFERRGIEPQLTEKGAIVTDSKALALVSDDQTVARWLEYKAAQKILGTYLDAWRNSITRRVHARYRLLLRTGRTSSHSPNLQQVPSRGKRGNVKIAFVPDPPWQLYELDYGQLELCCLAYLTQGTMHRLINDGMDCHRYLASIFFDKPASDVTKDERQLCKAANFGYPGGMGAGTFRAYAMAFGLPDPGAAAASRLLNAWLAAYPEMRAWRKDVLANGFAEDLRWLVAGRAEDLDAVTAEAMWLQAEEIAEGLSLPTWARRKIEEREGSFGLERVLVRRRSVAAGGRTRCPVSYTESRNHPFQAIAANLAKEALAMIVLDNPGEWITHAFIHDAVLISASGTDAVEEVRRRMIEAARLWIPGVLVKVSVSGPGENWYQAKQNEWKDE